MAEDIRESILSRLEDLLATAVPTAEVMRNVLLDDDAEGTKTRIVILEGDEQVSEDQPLARPPNGPRVMHMQPQIMLENVAKSADVGPGISALRVAVIKAITTDAALIALTVNGRGGRYLGLESDLVFGHAMTGQVALKFQFTYVLRPDQF